MSAMTERLHDAFEAFNAGDLDRFDELCDPDVEFSTFLGRMEGRTYRGTEGVHEWFANIREAFGDFRATLGGIEERGDVAICEVEFEGTGTASGVSLSEHVFMRVVFRNGLAAAWSWHGTREAAREGTRR